MTHWWSKDRFLTGACSVFSLAVWLYPADFRLRFGPEMMLTFRESLHSRFPSGFLGVAEYLLSAMANTLGAAIVFRGEESAWLKGIREASSRSLAWASLMVVATVTASYCFLSLMAYIAPHFYIPKGEQPVPWSFWSRIYLPMELVSVAVLVAVVQQAAFLRHRLRELGCRTAGLEIFMGPQA